VSARQPHELLLAAQHQVADTIDEAAAGALDFMHLITIDGNRLIVGSRAVATAFRKAHKNVIRNVDATRASKNPIIAAHGRLNFEPTFYTDRFNRQQPEYLMTRDGFTELAMSFTGDRARLVRIGFIAAFNAMARQLRLDRDTLQNQFFEVELELKNEQLKVSGSARNMRKWQIKKPILESKMNQLRVSIQLNLGFSPDPGTE